MAGLGLVSFDATAASIDGASLSPTWGIPFAALLLSIAVFPLLAPHFWHAHFGKIAALWAVLFIVPFGAAFGASDVVALIVHALIAEYIPFIAVLAALYTVAGGICLQGRIPSGPLANVGMLALGGVLASIMGTTGAAMLLIRPLLRANAGRKQVVHVVVFFIFIVANAGGSLTPLGDPPLFLGFLKGVPFFWTLQHLLLPMLLVCGALLVVFFFFDQYFYRKHAAIDARSDEGQRDEGTRLSIDGKWNFALLLCVIALILLSGVWKPGITFDVMGTPLPLQNLVRDLMLFVILFVSLAITPASARAGNQFDWAPIAEVAKLFAAIFLTIAPVILMLAAGKQGAFAPLVTMVNDANGQPIDSLYFWATGVLSGFLDNAPTYLVFFNTAGGDASILTTSGATTLAAISAGAVFMGALTYIGNAPNFMVKAIAEERGIAMPSFFGYMVWSMPILIPLFCIVGWLFF